MFILLLGAPGAGKGTQGKVLAERLGLPKITTGDILRAAVQAGTPLGKEAKRYMDGGKLVPDAVILGLIKDELVKPEATAGAILDGFPRTAAQAELVDRTLAERGQRLNHILLLDVAEDELVRRLQGRASLEGRSDDTPEAIRTRLEVYQRDTAPLIAHYAQRGNVHRVPATGTVEEIATEIKRILHEVVHGIPSPKRILREGDLLSVDVGVWLEGLHADSAATFPVVRVSPEAQSLLQVTVDALAAGVAQARAGNHVGDVGHAVQQVAEGAGYSVVRELVGHGIGASFRARDDDRDRADGQCGGAGNPHARRQVDRRDGGWIPLGALRAHRCGR